MGQEAKEKAKVSDSLNQRKCLYEIQDSNKVLALTCSHVCTESAMIHDRRKSLQ